MSIIQTHPASSETPSEFQSFNSNLCDLCEQEFNLDDEIHSRAEDGQHICCNHDDCPNCSDGIVHPESGSELCAVCTLLDESEALSLSDNKEDADIIGEEVVKFSRIVGTLNDLSDLRTKAMWKRGRA